MPAQPRRDASTTTKMLPLQPRLPGCRLPPRSRATQVVLLALLAVVASGGPVEDSAVGSDDYYEVLGLPRGADAGAVEKHYRKLAMHWHPDKNKDPAADTNFKRIAEAYEVLSSEEARKLYDSGGKAALRPENQQRGGGGFNFDFGRK